MPTEGTGYISFGISVSRLSEVKQGILPHLFHTLAPDGVYIQALVDNDMQSTLPSSLRRLDDNVEWPGGAGELVWRMENNKYNRMKALSPTIKLQILAKNISTTATTSRSPDVTLLGFALLDLRGIDLPPSHSGAAAFERDLAVYWKNGVASTAIQTVKSGATTIDKRKSRTSVLSVVVALRRERDGEVETAEAQPSRLAIGEGPSGQSSGVYTPGTVNTFGTTNTTSTRSTQSSVSSTLLVPEMDAIPIGGTCTHGFAMRVALRGLSFEGHFLSEQLTHVLQHIAHNRDKCWLSYKIFGALSQTDKFELPLVQPESIVSVSPFPAIHDEFMLQSTLPDLVDFFTRSPPLQIFLCTRDTAIAVCSVPMTALLEPAVEFMNSSDPAIVTDIFPGVQLEGSFPCTELAAGSVPVAMMGMSLLASIAITPSSAPRRTLTGTQVQTVRATDATNPDHTFISHGTVALQANNDAQEESALDEGADDAQNEIGVMKLSPIRFAEPSIQCTLAATAASNEQQALLEFLKSWKASPDRFSSYTCDILYTGSVGLSTLLAQDGGADDDIHAIEQLYSTAPASGDVIEAEGSYSMCVYPPPARSDITFHVPTAFSRNTGGFPITIDPFGEFSFNIIWRVGYVVYDETTTMPASMELTLKGTANVDASTLYSASLVQQDFMDIALPVELQSAECHGATLSQVATERSLVDFVKCVATVRVLAAGNAAPIQTLRSPQLSDTKAPAADMALLRQLDLNALTPAQQMPHEIAETEHDQPPLSSSRHRWRFTIDVRSIRDLETGVIAGSSRSQPASSATFLPITVRYQYPELGAACALETLRFMGHGDNQAPSVLHPPAPRFPVISSFPPVYINKLSERSVPHAHASMHFELAEANLATIFRAFPLGVYMQAAGTASPHLVDAGTPAVGTCVVNLAALFDIVTDGPTEIKPQHVFRCPKSSKTFASMASYRKYWKSDSPDEVVPEPVHIRVVDVVLPILAAGNAVGRVTTLGTMRVIAYLEDLGLTGGEISGEMPALSADDVALYRSAHYAAPSQESTSFNAPAQPPTVNVIDHSPSTGPDAIALSPADPASYRAIADPLIAAMIAKEEAALNAWRAEAEREWISAKAMVEDSWRKEAEQVLASKTQALESSWAEREAERQTSIAAAQESCSRVEAKLRKLLTAAETKEKEIDRLRDEAKSAFDAKAAELNAVARRLREDAEHAASIAKQREAAAAARVSELNGELESVRLQYINLRKEYDSLTSKVASGPDTALRDAIASLQAERTVQDRYVSELKASLATEVKAKEEARVQVLRLAKEVARLRDEIRAREGLEAQRLKVMYLAAEERYVLEGDRAALQALREEASRFGDATTVPGASTMKAESKSPTPRAVGGTETIVPPAYFAKTVAELLNSSDLATVSREGVPAGDRDGRPADETSRLKAERRLLTSSAPRVYTASHPVIREIDKRLASLQEANTAST